MIQFPRMAVSAALVWCAAMNAGAVEPGNAPEARKEQLIRAALSAGGFSFPQDRIEKAGALYAALQNASGGPLFTFRTTGLPACSLAALDDGRRIVIDLADMVNSLPQKTMTPQSPSIIQGVRTSLFAIDPRFVSRLVLDLSEPCAPRMEKKDRALRIHLAPKSGAGQTVYIDIQSDTEETPCPEVQVIDRQAVAALESHLRSASIPETQARVDHLANSLKTVQEAPVLKQAPPSPDTARMPSTQPRMAERQNPEPPAPLKETVPQIAERAPQEDSINLRVARLSGSLRSVSEPTFSYGLDSPWLGAAAAEGEAQTATPSTEGETVVIKGVPFPAPPSAEGEPQTAPAGEGEGETEAQPEGEGEPQPGLEGEPPGKRAQAPMSDDAAKANRQLYQGGSDDPSARLFIIPEPDRPKWTGDPMEEPISLDCVDAPLSFVVSALKFKAGVNVIASTVDLSKTVQLRLRDVPLRQAMETALSVYELGLIEEKGIYRIVPIADARRAQRITRMVKLENAKSDKLLPVLTSVISGDNLLKVSQDPTANVVVITGPEEKVNELVALTSELDMEKSLPMVTKVFKLNHAEPEAIQPTIQSMLTTKEAKVMPDKRARQLIVTAMPVEVEQVAQLIKDLDEPVKQVAIESMVVDAVLTDSAATGVDWLMNSVRSYSRRNAALGNGRAIGNLQQLNLDTNMQALANPASALNFALLTGDLDWRGIIQAEVQNRNGHLVSNPVMLTMENKKATITIESNLPYTEIKEAQMGGTMTGTQFIKVGTQINVTPRVTGDNKIIVDLDAKESGTQGELNGVPIENIRQVTSNILMDNGQTVFVGGLRKNRSDASLKKVPILGDVPVMNFLFSTRSKSAEINDLMVFLTCEIVGNKVPALTPKQQQKFDEGKNAPEKVNLSGEIVYDTVHPDDMRDPAWKWRR